MKKSVFIFTAVLLVAIFAACFVACEKADIPDIPDDPTDGNTVSEAVQVRFYSDGMLYGMSICVGTAFAMPEDPTKEGYSFVGWFYDEALTLPFILDEFLAKEDKTDISLYAAWNKIELPPEGGDGDTEDPDEGGEGGTEEPEEPEEKTYTVTFVMDGETVSVQEVKEGASAALPLPQYSVEGNELYSLSVKGNFTEVTGNETVELSYVEASYEDKGLFALGKCTLTVKNGKLYVSDVEADYPFDWIVFPSAAFGIFKINGINDGAFARVPHIVSVSLGDYCTEIDWNAFSDLPLLEGVEFSGGNQSYSSQGLFITDKSGKELIKYIGEDGGDLVVPNGITEVTEGAFSGSGFTSVELPEGLERIGKGAFANSAALASVTLPSSIIEIGESAFENCAALSDIALPKSLRFIGDRAFARCLALDVVYYNAENAEALVENNCVFDGAGSMSGLSFVVGKNVLKIPARLFDASGAGDICLNSIEFEKDCILEEIGVRAFAATEIESVEIPSSVKVLSSGAFKDCAFLLEVIYRAQNAVSQGISGTAFAGAGADGAVFTVSEEAVSVPDYLLFSLGEKVNFSTLILKEGALSSIGYLSFAGEAFEGNVTIPSSVSDIGEGAFSQTKLTDISVAEGNKNFASENGVLYTENKLSLVAYPAYKADERYVVDGLADEISAYAFAGAAYLKEIEISCARVGDMAFYNCNSLCSVGMLEGVNEIGTGAFSYCGSIKDIACPSSLEKISENAFAYCNALESVTLNEGLKILASYAFAYCPLLGEVTLPSSLESVGEGVFAK